MFASSFLDALKKPNEIDSLHNEYVNHKPFPFIVLDQVFRTEAIAEIVSNFPKPDGTWWKYDNPLERKFAKDDLSEDHFLIQWAIASLQSRFFVGFLERITGISGLIPDHTLRGGGLHGIARGGKLDIHADHNTHPVTKLDRRVNVLLYLNPGWIEAWGGHLEFWNKNMTECVQRIAPIGGRMVIFSTNDTAYHGHPDPLVCPEGVLRKSIAVYYYTNGRPEHEKSPAHSVLYQRRPQDPYDRETNGLRALRSRGPIQPTKDAT